MQFVIPGKASVVVGGQFGSEAKGLVAAYLAGTISTVTTQSLVCTTNAGAQAGHTTILDDGRKFVCFHLPTIGVMLPGSTIYLNAGSIVDLDVLWNEIHDVCAVMGEPVSHMMNRISIHPNAALITSEAKEMERAGATEHLGSTQKGVGAALADKIMRHPGAVVSSVADMLTGTTPPEHGDGRPWHLAVRELPLTKYMDGGVAVTVEIPQGTGLSVNAAPFYPKCTSRDCWVMAGLTDAGIHASYLHHTAMVVRTMPIRVGNIMDPDGRILGYSGDFYHDSTEKHWEQLPGIEPERTTVTKRVRRIATWSRRQYRDALRLNRPTLVFLTFTNYMEAYELARLVGNMVTDEMAELGYSPSLYSSNAPNVGSIMGSQPELAL